jgi:hypothetical protein
LDIFWPFRSQFHKKQIFNRGNHYILSSNLPRSRTLYDALLFGKRRKDNIDPDLK